MLPKFGIGDRVFDSNSGRVGVVFGIAAADKSYADESTDDYYYHLKYGWFCRSRWVPDFSIHRVLVG